MVDGAPEIVRLAVDLYEDLIQMPLILAKAAHPGDGVCQTGHEAQLGLIGKLGLFASFVISPNGPFSHSYIRSLRLTADPLVKLAGAA